MNKKNEKPELKKADNRKQREFETIESNFFKFEKIGDSIEGAFVTRDTIFKEDETKKFDLVTLKNDSGEFVKFHTSKQLDDLMNKVDLGDYIRVTYIDNQQLPNGTLKIFNLERELQ